MSPDEQGFFRDPEAWDTLKQHVVDPLLERTPADEPLRLWVPGCGTGEEAYSLAILFHEEFDRLDITRELVIFATDVNGGALAIGRHGRYPRALSADMSDERLERFFRLDGEHFRLVSDIRHHVVFAAHSILRDPPFARVHLVSCRNVLNYLDHGLQEHAIRVCHYACRDDGFLFLGTSETANEDLFEPVHRTHRIYRARSGVPGRPRVVPELTAASSDATSLNEKYHATMEELETSKEELQSPNEELQTMNQELKLRLEEVSRAHSDLDNLIAVTNVATLFLDADLRIKRYTRQFADLFNVRPRDIDRPIGDLRHSLHYHSLEVDARHVLNTISGLERHTTSLDGQLYIVRLSPYRTATDHRADGVVVTFIDVSDVARAEAVRQSEVSKAETSQIRGLFGRLVYVQEEERRRISRDIHDQMGQQMTALRMQIESLRLQAGSMTGLLVPITRLERLAEEIDQSLDFITRELRPAALDRLGLSAALREMVRGWSERFRIPAGYHATHGDVAVTGDIAVNLYRILQEALNNICKHAGATHVTVLLAVRNGRLTLVIEDDGRGFTYGEDVGSRDAGRLGLIGMRERARLMGGEFAIETAPDQGTSLFVHVPFDGDSVKATGSAVDS